MTHKSMGLIAALLLILSACAGATASGEPTEGIGVEGAWTIDVYNADGTLAETRSFHNALDGAGAVALAAMLARDASPAQWAISLDNTAQTTDPCVLTSGSGVPCGIWEPVASGSQDATANSFNLTVGAVESAAGSGVLDAVRLAGSVAASADGAIGVVSTALLSCNFGATTCASLAQTFTSTVLVDPANGTDAPIPVTVGQVVQVEVVLSFGTL